MKAAWSGQTRVGTRGRCYKVTVMDVDCTYRDQTSTAASGPVVSDMGTAECSTTVETHSNTTTMESGHAIASAAQVCAAIRAGRCTRASGHLA